MTPKALSRIKDFFKHRCHFYFDKSQIDEDYLINDNGVLEKQEPKAYRYYKCKCGLNYKTI